jgi:Skp family chaperone for outer membrane proteins
MTRYALGTALAALALAVPGTAVAQRNNNQAQILIVDTARVFSECTACRAAAQQMQTQLTTLQQRRQTLGQQLQTEGQPIQTAVNALNGKAPDAALTSRIQAFETRQEQASQEIQRAAANIQSTEAHVQQQIGTRVGPIVEQIRAARRAAIVLSKNSTLASDDALEVTNEVLTQLNQQLPSVSVTPLPQQQQPAAGTPAQPQQQRPQGR